MLILIRSLLLQEVLKLMPSGQRLRAREVLQNLCPHIGAALEWVGEAEVVLRDVLIAPI
jgi:hypothetical protein